MDVIANKWVGKEKKKRLHETATTLESSVLDICISINLGNIVKRNNKSDRSTMVITLAE